MTEDSKIDSPEVSRADTDVRDVIAEALADAWGHGQSEYAQPFTDAVLEALAAAGLVVVPAEDVEAARDELDNLATLAEAASPGPWRDVCMGSEGYVVLPTTGRTLRERGRKIAEVMSRSFEECKADAAFIAATRSAVPEIAARLSAALPATEETPEDPDKNVCGSCGEESDELYVIPGQQDGPRTCRACETDRLGEDPETYAMKQRARLATEETRKDEHR